MKQIINYLKSYYKEHLNIPYFIAVCLYTGILLLLNFYLEPTKSIRSQFRWTDHSFLYYVTLYSIGFIIPYLGYRLFFKKEETTFLFNLKFWGLVLFALLLFSSRSSLIYYYQIYFAESIYGNTARSQFVFRAIYNLSKGLLILLPLLGYWLWADRQQPFYGISKKKLNLKPYFIMILVMVPIIIMASQNPGFLKKYPRAQLMPAVELFDQEHTLYILGYELLYVLDFYAIELFFRGFLILAFVKYVGAKAILPAAVFYVCIHFGKPPGEALSSFFGGALLGIISYYSRSIWGGIIIHMSIAATMEICAYVTHFSQS